MPNPLDVLIVASSNDSHAQAVLASLIDLGCTARTFSLNDLGHTRWTSLDGHLTNGISPDHYSIDSTTTVWWRRPGHPPTDGLADDDVQLVRDEAPHAIRGSLAAANPRWVDEPFDVLRADHKLHQLAVARSLRIHTPTTIVTNDAEAARRFADGRFVIAKALSPGVGIAPYTSKVESGDLELVERLPTLLQIRIEAAADIRSVVVGNRVFSWRRPREPGTLDWRAVDPAGAGFVSFDPDGDLVAASLAITSGVRCSMGALDWLETDDGVVFLEINPQGQWLFLQGATETVVPALAEHLMRRQQPAAGYWPSVWQRIGYDLQSADKAPPSDGVKPPGFTPPLWLAEVAAKDEGLETARLAHQDARDAVNAAEDKAGRFVQLGLTLLAVALAVAGYQAKFAADRFFPWWLTLVPAIVAATCLALATFEATQVDRVAHYRSPAPADLALRLNTPANLVLLEIEEEGRFLARWAATRKHSDLMQARAWFTRGLVALVIAGVMAVVASGFSSVTGATDIPTTSPASTTVVAPVSSTTSP